jgi:NADH-quinone oxidoreductase subunit E
MVNGCHAVVERLHARLGIGPGDTSADGRFTLRTVECLAACDEAPSVIVDEDRWARVGPDDVDRILERYA